MELKNFECLLGIEYNNEVRAKRRVILPANKWQCVNERVDEVGRTHLMEASRYGSRDCVELLLKCGLDVNTYDRKGKRAIDYSLDHDHAEVSLMLLAWDSLLPSPKYECQNKRMNALIGQSDSIKQFFIDRDNFHNKLINLTPESVGEMLKNPEDACNSPKYWVNSKGESALYTAGISGKYEVWALLSASGFVYATDEEKEEMKYFQDDNSFHWAIGKYFVELSGCHVQKMVAKSKWYRREGEDERMCGEKVNRYFKDIDSEEYLSDLLKCLQDDVSLEIVFDFSSEDIQSIHPINTTCLVYGLTDFKMNRVYVAAKEIEGFDYFDVVSNLVHELTHKTLSIVFGNGGLPYRLGDTDAMEEYQNIVKNIFASEDTQAYDKIIQRVAQNTDEGRTYELIVRVPEMLMKYTDRVNRSSLTEDGFSRLRRQVPCLLNFYNEHVCPAIREHIRRNQTANKVVRCEVLKYVEMLTAYYNNRIQVGESIKGIELDQHIELKVMRVSNLSLGVSHLKSLLEEEVVFVDWSRYKVAKDYFSFAVGRNEIKRLAIIWDERVEPPILCCSTILCNNMRCISKQLSSVVHRSILIVPKRFPILRYGKYNDYTWNDLISNTKEYILEKTVNFGGIKMELKDVVGSICGFEAVESKMDELLGADELSSLIDQDNVQLGRPLESTLKQRGFELLRSHPECFIPRTVKVRRMEFNKEVFQKRTTDAFFIWNADEIDLKEAGFSKACVWDGKNVPGTRCFILGEKYSQMKGDSLFEEMFEKLRDTSSSGLNWQFAHFFTLVGRKYIHDYSLNCAQLWKSSVKFLRQSSGLNLLKCSDSEQNHALIIADAPGSGKSVFVNKTAWSVKRYYPKCWVGVVELPLYEEQIKQWKEPDLVNSEKVLDFLYEMLKGGNLALERELFTLFCQGKKKTFIFFDAFDEICPKYKQKVTTLLKTLKYCTNISVCLTTRTHESTDLESHLSTLAYTFVPFDRSQQVQFLNLEWNASLKALTHGERINKIRCIILHLQSHQESKNNEEISALIENLKLCLEKNISHYQSVNFVKLAEKLIESGKFMARQEGDFSETPLHAWMFASVTFEENFSIGDSLSIPQLYKRFVDLKLDLYNREKAKAPECIAGDSKKILFKSTTYDLLKRFSVFFFLEDKAYKLKKHEMPHVLRIGVVEERSGSFMFVHRTFGEYLFSLWLLEKARKKKVTNLWLRQVLLENRFEKVRQFIDNLLLSEYGKESPGSQKEWREWKKSILSRSAFPSSKVFVDSIQKCLYTCIVECHEGILQYLAECSADCVSEVMFGKPRWDMKSTKILVPQFSGVESVNAFTFCGDCMKNRAFQLHVGYSKHCLYSLQFLTRLLFLVEKHDLTLDFHQMIMEDGLWWTGIHEQSLWKEEEGKIHFSTIFEYLAKHGSAFSTTMKNNFFDDGALMTNVAINAFNALVSMLDAVFDDAGFLEFFFGEGELFPCLEWCR